MNPEPSGVAEWEPLILAVAPNGAYKSKRDHPGLPMTPAEIARTAAECCEAGASMLHLHVRDHLGGHTLEPDTYRQVIDAVKGEIGERMLIQVTSEFADIYKPDEQMAAIRALRPESVSLGMREIIPDASSEQPAAEFLQWVVREQVIPQFIVYSPEEVVRYNQLRHRGIIPTGLHPILFVLGRYSADHQSDPAALVPYLSVHDRISPWMMCAFGLRENACAATAAALGGHVRVGFENNLHLKDGSLAPGNAALVDQARSVAEALGRPLADADTAREMMRRS